ncbi:MAG: S9 family peptidase [Proteobacteria bacterium]|nr:S9 family peptidase [Pseudomonadota bacterium]
MKQFTGAFSIVVLLAVLSTPASAADEIPVEDFVAHPKYRNLQISPDGHHLAVIAPVDGINHLVFLDITDIDRPTQVGVLAAPRGEQVSSIAWVNDERVVVQTSVIQGALELPRLTGRIQAVNFDGSKKADLWSIEKYRTFAQVIDTIDDEDDYVIVSHQGIGRQKPIVERLNVYSGRSSRIGISPLSRGGVLLDDDQNLRFAIGRDDDLELRAAYRKEPNGAWTTFENPLEGEVLPLAMAGDDRTVFVSSDATNRMGVHALDLETGLIEPVAIHDRVEAYSMLWSRDGKELIGVEFLPGLPEIRYVSDLHEDRDTWESLLSTFQGMHVRITSVTSDNNIAIVATFSDRQPATWYHYDIPNGKLQFLVSARPEIDPAAMAHTESHWITSRDGLEFQLYVTRPRDAGDQPLPTIMYIHGGPHGPRDEWAFQAETQMLANRGYVVIQPNYRGSGGFGEFFEETGYRKWYGEMQDDITDATLWAIEQGIADEDKVCIYGASYGGFATLAGLTKEPDLYACGFAFVGIYDLELMYKYGDIQERKQGRNVLEDYIGRDEADLKARSPINHVANIKSPLYIAHGKNDVRAHVEHFYALRDRLEEENIPFEQLLVEKEGHGFYKIENRVNYANELLGFLDQYIGPTSGKL